MGTNAIIIIQEPFEFRFPVSRGIKAGFLMPEFHNRFDDPFGFTVGFGITHPGEALLYSVLLTELHERVVLRIPLVLFAVVGVVLFDRIRTFLKDLLQKGLGRYLGLIRKDGRIELPGEVVNGNEQVRTPLQG